MTHLSDGTYMVIPDLQVPLSCAWIWKDYQWCQYLDVDDTAIIAAYQGRPDWRDYCALADDLYDLYRD